jgi:hypothetical protein
MDTLIGLFLGGGIMSAYVIPVLVLALFVFSFVAVLMVSVGSADDSAFDEEEPPKDRSLYLAQAHGAMLDDIQIRKEANGAQTESR